ncbi:zinc finger domain-containing protein [Streptomyces anulatus]|uniref:zinc finger domain-containing protein n=1 Tax=Streptomyces anulatus TaxID=1892 RepID=UPI0036408838
MTEEEAIQIAEYVAAACPAQKFGEFTPDVWGEILAPYDVNDARRAVIDLARRQRWISPGEIVDEVKARRAERIELAHVVYDGDPLETGAQSAASRRALITAAADGHLPPRTPAAALGTADRLALPPGEPGPYTKRIAAARAAVGQAVPTAREGVVNPRAIPCRICQALPGTSCEVRGRRMRDVHPARLDDAKRRAAGLPPIDPDAARAAEDRIRAATAALAAQAVTTEET